MAGAVEVEQPGDLGPRTDAAEHRALNPLLQQGQLEEVEVYGRLREIAHARDDYLSTLAGQAQRLLDVFALDLPDRDDRDLGHLAPREVGQFGSRVSHGGERVGGTEFEGLLAFEVHRVDGDDEPGPRELRPLHGVDADAADADHHHRVARAGVADLGGRAPTGRDTTAQ
ncbi:hypothetical protein BN970_02809 [Mycolicibacterium conceptionense]|uniref:Uncharacterized protein n=1 Tax=Mycolicibacterium conceptionense TaxID=451644 RepID=A0A0U1DE99_9MYCO|nr:hypothetical protein BN970_02809 [Mycolicibacterium conceptionense]